MMRNAVAMSVVLRDSPRSVTYLGKIRVGATSRVGLLL